MINTTYWAAWPVKSKPTDQQSIAVFTAMAIQEAGRHGHKLSAPQPTWNEEDSEWLLVWDVLPNPD